MAFIRVKKIKKWEYAYLVENKWKGSGARQKVKGYLGRVHRLENEKNIQINANIDVKDYRQAISDIVRFELLKKGFSENKGVMEKEGIRIDLENNTFTQKSKNVVLRMNEGFLCPTTYAALANMRAQGNEEEFGLKLAQAIVDAGLNIPEQVFVRIFDKKFKAEMPAVEDKKSFI